jgi:hypothetical protein
MKIQVGDRFGKLVAVGFSHKNKHKHPQWLFKCDCGTEKVLGASQVKIGQTSSCGCKRFESRTIKVGEQVNHWTAIGRIEKRGSTIYWKFRCSCGRECVRPVRNIVSGHSRSCGCVKKSRAVKSGDVFTGWTAIRFVSSQIGGLNQRWLFRCQCGCERVLLAGSVKSGHSKSCGCLRKLTREESRIGLMVKLIKSGAKKRNISFSISKSDIALLATAQQWRCRQTGVALDLTPGFGRSPLAPSIDRIDSSRGYEPDNIQLVCMIYNLCKNEYSDDDVLAFARSLVDRAKSGNLPEGR